MPNSFFSIIRPPDLLHVISKGKSIELAHSGRDGFAGNGVTVTTKGDEALDISVSAEIELAQLHLRWCGNVGSGVRILGDHWERGYGDLEWRGLVPDHPLPWYMLTFDGELTHGYGVRTGASSICWFGVDDGGISLWLDVRNGGRDVRLGSRTLNAATVVSRHGQPGETPFTAAQAFCRLMCPNPCLPPQPVYGGNNWYYAYGHSTHQQLLDDSQRIADWSPGGNNRPFMVVDDGWQMVPVSGPWYVGNRAHPDMHGLAGSIKRMGVRPGIWMRPLLTAERLPEHWFLSSARFTHGFFGKMLDPTISEVKELIAKDVRGLTEWGYELIKHDFSTYDIFGRWGFEFNTDLTTAGWGFSDCSKTTAEIIKDFYETIRHAAGNALLIGCNTIGHLGAGLFELQRTGDDTSGNEWKRTRKMGINTLAFRMPQHNSFFAVDADCVGLTNRIPWKYNRQWLDLLARSGTPLFVSADPAAVGSEQKQELRRAFSLAATPQPMAEPIDWLDSTCPSRWRINGEIVHYDWFG
jgi:alpha-galactosidase